MKWTRVFGSGLSKLCGFIAVGALMACSEPEISPRIASAWPTNEWSRSSPEEQGLDSMVLARALEKFAEQPGVLHSLAIVRHGVLVLDYRAYPYDGTTPHDIASVTKSITTSLLGVAVQNGHIRAIDSPVVELLGRDMPSGQLANVRLEDLATMRSGLNCGVHGDEREMLQMVGSDNWIEFAVSIPLVGTAGVDFAYCSPGMHLLAAAVSEAVGSGLHEFAQKTLFASLGIKNTEWPTDPQGLNVGWGDLRMLPTDMAKIGLLYLHGGRWDGEVLLPPNWVASAFESKSRAPNGDGYGLGWWIPAADPGVGMASGRGGQFILVVPRLDLVVVTTGSAFDLNSVASQILDSIKSNDPLPRNQAAESALEAVTSQARVERPFMNRSAAVDARLTSARFYMEANPIGVRSVQLVPDSATELTMCLSLDGLLARNEPKELCILIGLDGYLRESDQGFSPDQGVFALGEVTAGEFVVTLLEEASPNRLTIQFRALPMGRVQLNVSEATGLFEDQQIVGTSGQE